jgi:hypothetical protein
MSRPDPIPTPDDPPADRRAAARALIEGNIAMLTRLAEVGMGIAEDAGRRSHALAQGGEDAGADAPDPALSYARAARAVRMTIALQSRLSKDLLALDEADDKARAARAGVRLRRVHRLVKRALEDGEGDEADEDEVERLSTGAWERLRDLDEADLADRPLSEIVALICRDLGLSPQTSALALQAARDAEAGPFPIPEPTDNDDSRLRADLAAARWRGSS